MIDAPAQSDARQHLVLFVAPFGRNDRHDRPPDRLRGGKTEHPLSRAVPRRDDPVEVLPHDRIVARFDDGGEPLLSEVRIAGRACGILPGSRGTLGRQGESLYLSPERTGRRGLAAQMRTRIPRADVPVAWAIADA